MRARHRHFLVVLIAAISVALAPAALTPSDGGQNEAATCPGSTAWDNLLQRCV